MSRSQPARSMGSVAVSTLCGAGLSIASSVLLAAQFGRGATDALFMALSLPLVFGKFFQTGPLPQVIMPLLMAARARGETQRAERYIATLLTLALVGCGAIAAALWFAVPWAMQLLARGFTGERYALTVEIARWLLPLLLCTTLISILTAVWHAGRRFGTAEWYARIPSACVIIAAAAWAMHGIQVVAWAMVIGSVAQVGLLWAGLRRAGVSYRPAMAWRQSDVQTTWHRLLPFVITSAAVQLSLIVHRLVTSYQTPGTLSALSYAERITLFMTTMLGIVPTVMFPQIIEEALQPDRAVLRQRLRQAVLGISIVSFPLIALLAVLSQPITAALLQRGQFDAMATQETALALTWMSIGLVGWGCWSWCKTAAYAIQRPGIVNVTTIAGAAGVIILTLLLGPSLGLLGLAIASGSAPVLMAAAYVWCLRRDIPRIHTVVWNGAMARVVLAALLGSGLVCWVARETWLRPWLQSTVVWQLAGLTVTAMVSLLGYWVGLVMFGVEERRDAARWVARMCGLVQRPAAPPSIAVPLEPVMPVAGS